MKKTISIVLILAMLFTLAACNKSGGGSGSGNSGSSSEVGFWAYETMEFDLEKYNEGVDEDMKATEDEVEQLKTFYDMFLAGMYFEFKDDGTGIMGYVVEDSEEEPKPSEFTYSSGKFNFAEEEGADGFKEYTIKDGKMYIELDEHTQGLTLVLKQVDDLDGVKANMEEIIESLNNLLNG